MGKQLYFCEVTVEAEPANLIREEYKGGSFCGVSGEGLEFCKNCLIQNITPLE